MTRLFLAALLAHACARPVAAQTSRDIRLGFAAGWYHVAERPGSYFAPALQELRPGVSDGGVGGITADFTLGPAIGLRLATSRTAGLHLTAEPSYETDPSPDNGNRLARVGISAVSLDLMLSVPADLPVTPYARGGVGLRRYEFDRAELAGTDAEAAFDDQVQPAFQYGGGIRHSLGRSDIFVEATRYHSRYRGIRVDGAVAVEHTEPQRDVSVVAGMRWKL